MYSTRQVYCYQLRMVHNYGPISSCEPGRSRPHGARWQMRHAEATSRAVHCLLRKRYKSQKGYTRSKSPRGHRTTPSRRNKHSTHRSIRCCTGKTSSALARELIGSACDLMGASYWLLRRDHLEATIESSRSAPTCEMATHAAATPPSCVWRRASRCGARRPLLTAASLANGCPCL